MSEPEFFPSLPVREATGPTVAPVAGVRSSGGSGLTLLSERTRDPAWLLVDEGFTLAREHEVESLFAIGNGYIGNRGSLAEGSPLSAPATFAAGVFEMHATERAVPGLFVLPDWTGVGAWVEGQSLSMREGEVLEHRRVLDLRCGVLWREWRHRDPNGRITRVLGLRFASLADRHLLAQSVWLMPENYSGRVLLEAKIELAPNVVEFVPSEEWKTRRNASRPNVLPLALRAPGRDTVVAFGAASRLFTPEAEAAGQRYIEFSDRHIIERFSIEMAIGTEYRLDRIVSIYTSREAADPVEAALQHVHRVLPQGISKVLSEHSVEWHARWQDTDIQLEGDENLQRALRFAEYHLISCANPGDERVSIGARALTGEAYKGHVFWDTEIYMIPFYTFTCPQAARSLLMYRYHTLPPAREKARAAGFRGAMYPWESADTGEETTPRFVIAPGGEVIEVKNGDMEVHITGDIAYAVWRYWEIAGDDDFFVRAGAEILLECARFWASRGQWEADGRYHIRHVIGPDEYHEDVDDNVFTNIMAAWNLRHGVQAAGLLERQWPERWMDLRTRLQLTPEELQSWSRIADAMFVALDPKTHVFEQFQGFFQKEQVDLRAYEPRNAAMDVILGHERIQKTNVVKQADVLMAIALLWGEFSPEVRSANFRYYEPRTGHGSSLSPSVHAWFAARLGDLSLAQKYLQQAAEIDLGNNMGNAAGGVHAAAIGGLWQAMVFGFAGVQAGRERITLDPHLLPSWRRLHFPLQWRGRKLRLAMNRDSIRISVEKGEKPVPVRVAAQEAQVPVGAEWLAERAGNEWKPWRAVR